MLEPQWFVYGPFIWYSVGLLFLIGSLDLFRLSVYDQCKREGFLQRVKDEEGEGCNIYGFLEVNKVAGNFHFAPGKSFHQAGVHVHDLLAFQKDSFNVRNNLSYWFHFVFIIQSMRPNNLFKLRFR